MSSRVLRQAASGNGNTQFTGQVLASDGSLAVENILQAALSNHLATMDTGTRANIDNMVSSANSLFIMFYDNHRVADIAQVSEGVQQPLVVPLVQANGGFIKNIHDSHQSRAYLAGKADTLGLTAGQGVGAAGQ